MDENGHKLVNRPSSFNALVAREEILRQMAESFLADLSHGLQDGRVNGRLTSSTNVDLVLIEICIAKDKALLAQLEEDHDDEEHKRLLEQVHQWNQLLEAGREASLVWASKATSHQHPRIRAKRVAKG